MDNDVTARAPKFKVTNKMAGWTTRTSGYKLGVFLLFLSTLLYVVGYASPFWSDFDGYGSSGLWMACYRTFRLGVDEIECAALTGPSAGAI